MKNLVQLKTWFEKLGAIKPETRCLKNLVQSNPKHDEWKTWCNQTRNPKQVRQAPMEQNINRSTTKTSKKKTPRVNHNKSPHAMAIQNNHHHMQEQKTPGTQSMPGTRPLEATQRGKRKEREARRRAFVTQESCHRNSRDRRTDAHKATHWVTKFIVKIKTTKKKRPYTREKERRERRTTTKTQRTHINNQWQSQPKQKWIRQNNKSNEMTIYHEDIIQPCNKKTTRKLTAHHATRKRTTQTVNSTHVPGWSHLSRQSTIVFHFVGV